MALCAATSVRHFVLVCPSSSFFRDSFAGGPYPVNPTAIRVLRSPLSLCRTVRLR